MQLSPATESDAWNPPPGGLDARHHENRQHGNRLFRRPQPSLLVLVEGPENDAQLEWALQEAARRDATVVAVSVLDQEAEPLRRATVLAALEARVLRATFETGVLGRSRTSLLDPVVFEALAGAARGGDLIVVRPAAKIVLRRALPRPRPRRPVCAV